jgi:hypothetical protein
MTKWTAIATQAAGTVPVTLATKKVFKSWMKAARRRACARQNRT